MAKIALKLILASCFVFDKQGRIRAGTDMACFLIISFITYKRLTIALIFNKSVFYAMIFYEVEQLWLALCISIHLFSGQPITILSLILMFLIGIFLSFFFIMLQIRKKKLLILSDPKKFQTASEFELYIFRLNELIISNSLKDHYILYGLLSNHVTQCANEKC